MKITNLKFDLTFGIEKVTGKMDGTTFELHETFEEFEMSQSELEGVLATTIRSLVDGIMSLNHQKEELRRTRKAEDQEKREEQRLRKQEDIIEKETRPMTISNKY